MGDGVQPGGNVSEGCGHPFRCRPAVHVGALHYATRSDAFGGQRHSQPPRMPRRPFGWCKLALNHLGGQAV